MITHAMSETQKQKLQTIGQMAGGIAHDFNNLLSIIEGYTQIMQMTQNQNPALGEKLDAVMLATQRGTTLVQRLMEFGQDKPGQKDASCDLVQAIQDNQVLLRPVLGSRIELALRLPEEPVFIACDEDSISQLLINLALNARCSIPHTGTVTIEVSATRGNAVLSFSDNGAALAPEKLAELFRHSSPHPPAMLPKTDGAEMGLGLVARIVRQHQGTMDIAGTIPGIRQGTVFTMNFPRLGMSQFLSGMNLAGQMPPENKMRRFDDKTILVVDDEEALLPVLENQLGRLGMKVLKAANADSALLIQEHYKGNIDFLLTDLAMPGTDGVQLAERMNEARPKMGVIYMTGFVGQSDVLDRFTPLPPESLILPKPLKPDDLSAILQQALSQIDEI